MRLYDKGVYLIDGQKITETPGPGITREEAAKNTIAYGIPHALCAHQLP